MVAKSRSSNIHVYEAYCWQSLSCGEIYLISWKEHSIWITYQQIPNVESQAHPLAGGKSLQGEKEGIPGMNVSCCS